MRRIGKLLLTLVATSLLAVGAVALLLLPNPAPERLLRTSVLSRTAFEGDRLYVGVGRSATVATSTRRDMG